MIKRPMTIQIPTGVEDRPVAVLVQVASQYDSEIYLEVGNKRINAKSIMGMMSLGMKKGKEILVSADGADEEAAMENIEKFLCSHQC